MVILFNIAFIHKPITTIFIVKLHYCTIQKRKNIAYKQKLIFYRVQYNVKYVENKEINIPKKPLKLDHD